LLDGRGGLFGRGHFDKTKTARPAGHAVFHYRRGFNITRLREIIMQLITGRLERKVPYVKFGSHFYF
jgi:hypothetical protein